MRNIRDKVIDVSQLNERFQREETPAFWSFVVAQIGYEEVKFLADRQGVQYPEFIPVEEMIGDVLKDLAKGRFRPEACRLCKRTFDAIKAPGIFANRGEKTGFICGDCAKKLSAWEFYFDHMP